jgi:hypothetical protein
MCLSTGSERLSGFGENAQNQVDEALKYFLSEFHTSTARNAPNATNTAARNSSSEL